MDRRNIFTKALMVFLALMFLSGVFFGAVRVLSAEGQMLPEETYQVSRTLLPEGTQAIIDYLGSAVRFAVTEKAKLDIHTEISVDDKSISFGENGEILKKYFTFTKDSMLEEVAGQYPKAAADFGDNFTGLLWNLDFAPALIAVAQSKEDGDNYIFTVAFPPEENPFGAAGAVSDSFHMRASRNALEFLKTSCEGLAAASNTVVTCEVLVIEAAVNRLTDKISGITYVKAFHIETDITFAGELEALGTRHMTFILLEKTVFGFTFANLRLSPQKLEMEKGDVKVISAFITASGDVNVRWSSSAPDIASVDSEGYVKGRAVSAQPVIITAEFDFLGQTYSDTCAVYVKVPVKKIELSQKKVTLAAGDSFTLAAAVKPKDATIKDVLWQASNPAIAKVDKNGRVTAVSKGETEIVALSKDGYYKITCTVTVTA